MNAPTWLTQREGSLKLGSDRSTWYVVFHGQPHYALRATPASGKFGCAIRQTVNGQPIACAKTAPSADEAVAVGLETLRESLGWA